MCYRHVALFCMLALSDYLDTLTSDTVSFDSLTSVDAKARSQFGIVRVAKIGSGKKNIHFDPYGSSPCHQAMVGQCMNQSGKVLGGEGAYGVV